MEDSDEMSVPPGNGMKMTVFGLKKKFPAVKNINTATLFSWMKQSSEESKDSQNVVILDARPTEEYEVSHIPGAIRVDHSKQVEEIITDMPNVDSQVPPKIVCYCSVGYRSSVVADKLSQYYQKQGRENPVEVYNLEGSIFQWANEGTQNPVEVYNLEGSIFQWANEGRTMINGHDQPTKFAHPYSLMFGKLLNSELRKSKLE